ncbi:hypothetical protein [uncultured Ruminococcus sp.]|uniref:hypothetical protein n=1 Tax=uncultured Ruminococcus sp. TaxID=165186 RepID=UPI0025E9F0F0|nr:hypothetical protein [uncultured Ruminococcus sp.]
MCCSAPVGNDLKEFAFKNKILYDDNGLECFPVSSNATAPFSADYSFWEPIDVSYCPKEYSTTIMGGFFFNNSYYKEYYCCKNGIKYQSFIGFYSTECALSQLPVNQKKSITFTPKVDPLETYKFRLLGHDITVSPDILSSHIVATPQISEQEKYIAELEKKNAELTAEIERLKQNPSSMQDDIMRLDANGDGFVNAVDASIVLAIYANNSTNKTPITKLSEYFNIINGT